MLRLITLLSLGPLCAGALLAPIFPDEVYRFMDEVRPPEDLSVSAQEYARRNLIPGWKPVRPLTEDEIVRPWSFHRFVSGGYLSSGALLTIPVLPAKWTAHWPAPPPLEPTGVPWGWWWAPVDPAQRGLWLVVTKGTLRNHFYTLVTDPLDQDDHGRMDERGLTTALYIALRDREAKRRGVEFALLEREARIVESGLIPTAARDAMEQARSMWGQDRYEEALDLLERLIDEDAGTDRERALMRLYIIDTYSKMGELTRALAACREVRPYLEDLGMTRYVAVVDDKIINLEGLAPLAPEARPVYRALVNIEAGNDPAARTWLEKALPMIDAAADPRLDYDARAALAPVYERLGERDRAIETARDALARAVELELADEAAEMRALIARLE